MSLGYQGITINVDNGAEGRQSARARMRRCASAFELAIDRDAINQVVFNGEFVPGNQWVSPQNPYYQAKFPVPKRDVAKAKALLKEAGVTTPIRSTSWCPTAPRRAPSPRSSSRWRRRPAST